MYMVYMSSLYEYTLCIAQLTHGGASQLDQPQLEPCRTAVEVDALPITLGAIIEPIPLLA